MVYHALFECWTIKLKGCLMVIDQNIQFHTHSLQLELGR